MFKKKNDKENEEKNMIIKLILSHKIFSKIDITNWILSYQFY